MYLTMFYLLFYKLTYNIYKKAMLYRSISCLCSPTLFVSYLTIKLFTLNNVKRFIVNKLSKYLKLKNSIIFKLCVINSALL